MSKKGSTSPAHAAVELPARLVFSLLEGAVRVAARVEMPLARLTDLLRTAYFLEYRRRNPRDLGVVADKLGVSLRTAGTLNRTLKEAFFAPETEVEPIRQVTGALLGQALDVASLVAQTDLDESAVRRAVTHLVEVGWVEPVAGAADTYALSGTLRSFVTDDLQRRVDAINHQVSIVADSVWERFVKGGTQPAGARSWSFAARPEDVAEAIERTFAGLRAEAVGMEEKALAEGTGARFGITVAVAPLEEE
ncbi:MAG: hypothetical protein H6733_05865 [Alphaproteobacteria bacterium]|nr:hypothetical protein [Alphaproteobacteria bacterium]